MSAFIKQENQRVLWNTIKNIDLFHQVLTDVQQPLWFKEMIGMFYEKHRDRRLSRLDLENLNREVLEYMVSSLRMLYMDKTQRGASSMQPVRKSAIVPPQKRVSFQEDVGATAALLDFRAEAPVLGSYLPGSSSNLEKKAIQSQQYVSEFSTRQQEYEQMMKRETPPDVNFKEELSDNVIKNMDELLEKQRKERELDLQAIPPPLIAEPPRRIQPSQATYSQRKKLVFQEEGGDENLPSKIVDLSVLELQDSTVLNTTFGKNAMDILNDAREPNGSQASGVYGVTPTEGRCVAILEELKKEIVDIKQMLTIIQLSISTTDDSIEKTGMNENLLNAET